MISFNKREKNILRNFSDIAKDKNCLKLPTISLFLRDIYFREHKDMFLCVFNGISFLYIREGADKTEINTLFYNCLEMIFLFKRLHILGYINVVNVANANTYFMSPFLINLTQDKETGSILFDNGYLDQETMNISIENNTFSPIEISGIPNEIINEIIISGVFLSQNLVDFVNNGFITNEEKYAKKNLKVAWVGIGIATSIGIASIIISIWKG